MDHFHLFLTREEQIGDRIEFSIKKDIPIQFVKKLLQAKLPYHPDESTIQIFHNGDLLTDDVMVFSLKDELSNTAYLSFRDSQSYREWVSSIRKKDEISDELKQKIVENILENQPRRHRFEFMIDRGDGAVERRIQQHGGNPFVINLSIHNLIHSAVFFYVVYYTETVKKMNNWLKNKIHFTLSPFFIWFICTLLDILLPSIVNSIKNRKQDKKTRDMVDYTPKGFLGDMWLCIYYFFATLLPFNWGPRVFRD